MVYTYNAEYLPKKKRHQEKHLKIYRCMNYKIILPDISGRSDRWSCYIFAPFGRVRGHPPLVVVRPACSGTPRIRTDCTPSLQCQDSGNVLPRAPGLDSG